MGITELPMSPKDNDMQMFDIWPWYGDLKLYAFDKSSLGDYSANLKIILKAITQNQRMFIMHVIQCACQLLADPLYTKV